MNGYDRMAQSLIDIIKEQQAKLGYRKEVVRLYYPMSSLVHFFENDEKLKYSTLSENGFSENGLLEILSNIPSEITDKLGKITVTSHNERFCIEIPEQGSEYVHEHTAENEFINELIKLVAQHGCTKEEIISLFRKFSDDIEIKEMDGTEFDFYVRFLNDENNSYYYCFHDEGLHMIYHRFLPDDYMDFDF